METIRAVCGDVVATRKARMEQKDVDMCHVLKKIKTRQVVHFRSSVYTKHV